MSRPLKIFISYAHKDTVEKEELITRLTLLKRDGLIDIWHDNEILAGDKWRDTIFSNLVDSDLLLYLASAYSLASTNCNAELAAALNAKMTVIPIILENCDWEKYKISDFQALPDRAKPINKWRPKSDGWQNVIAGIRKTIRNISAQIEPLSDTSERELRAKLAFQHGNPLMMLGQLDMAIAAYSDAINLNPHNAEAYNNRGEAYQKKGEFDKAIKDYKIAIKLDPDYVLAYNNLGNVYSDKSKFRSALHEYNTAIRLDPKFPYAYNGRGRVYNAIDNPDEAIEDYKTAIELDPDYATPYNSLGKAYREKGEYNLAIENYNKAIELKPDSPLIYNNRGVAYRRNGEPDRAIEDFDKAIELRPDFEWPYSNRGLAYKDKGEYDRAIADITEAIKLNPQYSDGYRNRGNVYFHKGDFERAIEDYDKAIEVKENNDEVYVNRAEAYLHLEEWVKARVDLKTAKAMGADISGSFHETYESVENFEQKTGIQLPLDIAVLLRRTKEQNPYFAITYYNRGVTYSARGDFENAVADYNTAIKLNPQLALAYYNRGEAWLHQKEWDKAKADFTTAKRMGVDIIAMFHDSYKDVETYQKNRFVKLPEHLALLLTQRRRDRYPKLQKVLDADGNPLESPHVVNLREQLRNAGPPLSEYINTKSAFGINTAPTEVFVVDKATREQLITTHPSSADVLKPFLHGQDLRRWHVDTPQQWLIFTHRGIAIDDYPAILKYLEKHKENLQQRKGKQAWYELPVSLDNAERFAQPKLVCPNTYNYQTFAVDTEGFYYGNTSYLIPTEEKWLCGLLNSRTVEWFYSQVSNQLTIDPLRARSGYIQQIPIPDITPVHKAFIAKIVDYLIYLQQQPTTNSKDLKHARDAIMLGYFERVIDGLVYEAYLPKELHKSNKVFLQPLLDEQLPLIEEIQGDKMSAFRDIFELLYERTHPIRRNLFFIDSVKQVRVIQGKL